MPRRHASHQYTIEAFGKQWRIIDRASGLMVGGKAFQFRREARRERDRIEAEALRKFQERAARAGP